MQFSNAGDIEHNEALKAFSKKVPMTKFWFKQFFDNLPYFLGKWFQLVTQKLQITENFPFQMLRTFIFDLKIASKLFSRKLSVANFEFNQSWKLCLNFLEIGLNFVTEKFAKGWKMPFSNDQNIYFWAQGSFKIIF